MHVSSDSTRADTSLAPGPQAATTAAKPGTQSTGAGAESAPSGTRRDAVEISSAGRALAQGGDTLTPEEQREVRELQARDREVRAHEQAHKAAAGELAAGGPTYEYESGPDGRDYAVGGEVKINLKSGRTPEESVRLAQKARRAALAPAQPSAQDRSVAAQAAQMEAAARAEARQADEETETETEAEAGAAADPARIDAYRAVTETDPLATLPALFG